MVDETSFGKILVQGRDAEAELQRLAANDVAVPVGRTVYTGILNERGTFESDLTIARLARDKFLIVTGSAQPMRDMDWFARHVDQDAHVTLTDVTSGWTVLSLMGPRSRALLQKVSRADFSNEGFSVRHHPRGRRRPRHGAGLAPHLHGRAGLGALRAGRVRRHRVRDPARGGRGVRPARCRILRRREPAPGEGLSRLGPRADARRHALPGGARLGGEARQAGRLHRPKGAGRGQGQAAGAAPGVGGAGGRRAAAVGRRDAAARRQADRRPLFGRLRPHGGRVGGPGLRQARRRRGDRSCMARGRQGRGRPCRHAPQGKDSRCAAPTIRPARASRAEWS